MIKLLLGITLSEIGGSQRVIYNIISSLPESNYDITLITSPNGELIDWINALNALRTNKIKLITWTSLCREISLFKDIKSFVKLLKLLSKNKYDIVHFHNSKMGLIGRMAAKLCRIPKIYYTVHGWGLNERSTGYLYGIISFLERRVARFTTQTIFVSNYDLKLALQKGWAEKESARLIYNGIGAEMYLSNQVKEENNISKEIPIIIFVARLAEPKDPIFAIQVSNRLQQKGINHSFLIVGDGPKYFECLKLINELGIKHVLMLGKRYDVMNLLSQADIFCLFSKWEGLPISVIEAMISGLPIVASSVGGIPELVEHGENGFLLDEFDIDSASALLAELILNKEKRLLMGKTGQIIASQKFNLANMTVQYRNLYEEQ